MQVSLSVMQEQNEQIFEHMRTKLEREMAAVYAEAELKRELMKNSRTPEQQPASPQLPPLPLPQSGFFCRICNDYFFVRYFLCMVDQALSLARF